MGVEVRAATVPGDSWKAHQCKHGGDLGPGIGQVQTTWQGVIFITLILLSVLLITVFHLRLGGSPVMVQP